MNTLPLYDSPTIYINFILCDLMSTSYSFKFIIKNIIKSSLDRRIIDAVFAEHQSDLWEIFFWFSKSSF
jgi:hypothetical protein